MRKACLFAALLALPAGCSLDFQAQKDLPSGLARRIDQKRTQSEQQPSDARLALELGELYIEGERWFEAAEALNRAKTNGGQENSRVMGALATAYMSLGYYQQVEILLRDCFQRNRQEPGCLYAAGELMMLVGSKEALQAARTVWSNFVAIAPNHLKANYVRSALDQLNAQLGPPGLNGQGPSSQPSKAPSAQPSGSGQPNAAGHPPTPPPGHPPTGNGQAGTTDGAGAAVNPGIPGHAGAGDNTDVGELNPFGAALAKALAATRKNDAAGAEKAYLEALKIRPNDVSALAGLAEAQFVQKRFEEAVTTIDKAWTADPSDPQVRWVFGVVMIQARQRIKEAVQAWEALARDTPEYAKQLDLQKKLATAKLLANSSNSGGSQ